MKYLTDVHTLAISGSRHQERHLRRLVNLFDILRRRNVRLIFERRFAEYLGDCGVDVPDTIAEAIPDGVQAVASIGGDGSFLRAAQWVADKGIPILGINSGHLGFLANASIEEAEALVEELLSGRLGIEQRRLLELHTEHLPKDFWPYALNEVAITKEDTSSMITVSTSVDDDFLADYLGDGLVISTPTGSTAYNLSLGGPIIHPGVDCSVLTPIAPHTLTVRPMVVDGLSTVTCRTSSRAETYRVSCDGRSFTLPCDTDIQLRRAPFRILTLRRPGDNFASTLRNKLLWGSR